MGQICNISFWPLFTIKLGKKTPKMAKFAAANEPTAIQNYYLSNSKTFQDGNGNGNFGEINSNNFQDGNWESMELKGWLRTPRR